MKINAKTKLVGLIGNPVEHSFSPEMQNAAFEALGLNYVYLAFRVEGVRAALEGSRGLGLKGLNITIPHKTEAIKHLDEIDALAKKIGAINTVVNQGGKLKGYNTDVFGAMKALESKTGLKGKKALIIGAGGAGRAIAFGLKEKAAGLLITDSSMEKARDLAEKVEGTAIGQTELAGSEFDMLINATPVGMHPNVSQMPVEESLLNRKPFVFDIVYNPVKTLLLQKAEEKGCQTASGLEMLLNQGTESFRLWTGVEAPKKVMEEVLLKKLKGS